MSTLVPIQRALISVSDKGGLIAFAQALHKLGVEIISTGGTADILRKSDIPVVPIDALTGFPEMMDGRIKTLHPKVHGGLLARRDNPSHIQSMHQHGIHGIDLVCVNLYPFEQTVARADCTRDQAIENIDIGGPSMIRSAAKNHEHVAVVTNPAQYAKVMDELKQYTGSTTLHLRQALAGEAFALTARYDAAIAAYMAGAQGDQSAFPALLNLALAKAEGLRYGENPHQKAALYKARAGGMAPPAVSIASAEQLHGKELSYNNINDASAALELAIALRRVEASSAGACVIKHTNPCGAAIAKHASDAVDMAIAGDPVAAYGGIIAINVRVDAAAAKRMALKECFFEVIVAPEYDAEALGILQARWANVRLLRTGDIDAFLARQREHAHAEVEMRSIPGGMLVQERDTSITPRADYQHQAGPKPTASQLAAAAFLEAVGRSLFSNAVVLGGPVVAAGGEAAVRMFGAGAGQMDRVTSCRLAVEKAGPLAQGAIAYSDAFFPFPDGPQLLIEAGVAMIAHPGGSKRDGETYELCEKAGVSCVTTGVRHFRH
jgi:phosphoribosylaminoimidazolecarboxamide formyltransferase/IMP cyclohydrolase